MEINKKDYYEKEIPLNVKEYYDYLSKKLGEKKLKEYHVPYQILEKDGAYIFENRILGKAIKLQSTITNEQREAGEIWAKQKLRELHDINLIHGDLINEDSSGRIVI